MILYHYTAPTTSHLGSILADGRIETTESNISLTRTHASPSVVWLTDSADPARQSWVADVFVKLGAVLVVELAAEQVHHWPKWSREQGIDESIYVRLAATGGDPDSWWVVPRPVHKWDIKGLVIRTGSENRKFAGEDLSHLFRSSGARKNLRLPRSQKLNCLVGLNLPNH